MSETRPNVTIYTDGAAKGNPGPGGYGVVLLFGKHRKELSGGFRLTTNNRMELLAVIRGLEVLNKSCNITVYSDSKYVVDAIEKKWLDGWIKKGFKGKKNSDLWTRYHTVAQRHSIRLQWVKGHANIPENERCDRLAVEASEGATKIDAVYEQENK